MADLPKMRHYDEFADAFVYEVTPGRYINLPGREVRDHGAKDVLRSRGYELYASSERLPVIQHGCIVGTLPSDFEPWRIRSPSFLYDPRPGDFTRQGDHWVAANSLGPGDFECVPGFEKHHEQ